MAMAATTGSSSSSASAAAADKPAPALPPLTVKLNPTKYPLWLAQIIPLLNSRGLMSFVDGTAICPPAFLLDADGKPTNTTNPAYENWIQMDQFVLSLINDSLSHFVVATLAGSISARATWVALQALLVGAAEQQRLLPTLVVDHSTAAVAAFRGCGFDHLVSGAEMSGGGGGGGTTGEGVSGKKGLPGVKSFSPTEVELVGYYLKNKIEGKDSEFRDFIPVIEHFCKREPRHLPDVFFSQPDYKNDKRDRCKRTTDEGKYKVTGKHREIKDELSKTVIGKKRYLSFEDNVPNAKKTKYVIHEYSLTKTERANQQKEFVLCCLKKKSANSKKQKDDSIYGDELAEPAIGGKIASNSEDDQAAATDMIQGPDEHLADKDALLDTENRNEGADSESPSRNEGADSESPNGFSPTDNKDISTCVGSSGGFDVGSPGGFFLSDFGDLFNEPSSADLGINMDSLFLPPQPPQLAQPPHSPQPHQPPPPPQPHDYCSSTLQSALCTKQGNVPGGYNDDCSKRQFPIGDDNFCLTHENNILTNDHYEPVSNIAYSVQNGVTDERQHRLSGFDDLSKELYLGVNMDSTFLPPQQLAAISATTPTSATSPGSFGVGSPGGFFLSEFDGLFKEPFCADQPHQLPHPPYPHLPPHPHQPPPAPHPHQPPHLHQLPHPHELPHPHQPPPAPHPHQPPPPPHPHQPPPPPHPQDYCSSTLLSASCIKQGNVPGLYNDDCSKQISPTGTNISTNDHYEPVSNTPCCVQNGDTDERFSEAYFQPEDNLVSLFDEFRPQDYTLLPSRNTEQGNVMHANNNIDMQCRLSMLQQLTLETTCLLSRYKTNISRRNSLQISLNHGTLNTKQHPFMSFTHRWCSEKNPTAKLYHTTRLGKLQSIALLLFT